MKRFLILLIACMNIFYAFSKETNVKRPETYNYLRGLEAYHQNDYDEALTYFEKEVGENPKKLTLAV